MLLSALSFLVVEQSSSEVPEELMNNPVLMFYLYVHKYVAYNSSLLKFFSTSNCQCSIFFKKKILLSGFFAYPDGLPSQLIRISGVILYFTMVSGATAVQGI